MKKVICALFAIGTLNMADARLGDTKKEAKNRYGKVLSSESSGGLPTLTFQRYGMYIVLVFDPKRKRCISMGYEKVSGRRDLTDMEIEDLLKLSGGEWRKVGARRWRRHDKDHGWAAHANDLEAHYIPPPACVLVVAPKANAEAQAEAQGATEKKKKEEKN